jgi:hypothetical protein
LDVRAKSPKFTYQTWLSNVFLRHPGCFPGSRKERIRKRKVRLRKEETVEEWRRRILGGRKVKEGRMLRMIVEGD